EEIAGPDHGEELTLLHRVAAVDQDGVEIPERLRAHVRLQQRTEIHRGAHRLLHIADDHPGDRHQRRRPLPADVSSLAAGGAQEDGHEALAHSAFFIPTALANATVAAAINS